MTDADAAVYSQIDAIKANSSALKHASFNGTLVGNPVRFKLALFPLEKTL